VQISGSTYQLDNTTINVTFNVTNSPVIQINSSQIVLTGYTGGPGVTVAVGDDLAVFGDQFTAPKATFVNPGPPQRGAGLVDQVLARRQTLLRVERECQIW
jgi:hypothetical protein